MVKGGAFGGVALAQVLVEDGDDVGVPVEQRVEGAAGPDWGELAGIAHDHELAAGALDAQQKAGRVDVGREAGLIEHHDRPLVEREVAVVEPPDQRPQSCGTARRAWWPRVRAAWPLVAVPST